MAEQNGAIRASNAIQNSCIPLLCGSERAVLPVARRLFRIYGITSYGLIPQNTRRAGILQRLLSTPILRILPAHVSSPTLLAEAAADFFRTVDSPIVLPVLIDCTEARVLLSDPVLRSKLESRAFLSDPEHLSEIPPFQYARKAGDVRDP